MKQLTMGCQRMTRWPAVQGMSRQICHMAWAVAILSIDPRLQGSSGDAGNYFRLRCS